MPKLVPPTPVKRIAALGDGHHHIGHVRGLCLQVNGKARSYILGYSFGGRHHEMGLGSVQEVTLDDAIDAAREARKLIRSGIDPIARKREQRQEQLAGAQPVMTFRTARKEFIAAKAPEWNNSKHAAQWSNTLETYAGPVLDKIDVRRIETSHVLDVLKPIWQTKTETATRLRQRMEAVLDYCKAQGKRTGDNPARWKGHLDKLLPAPAKIRNVEHLAAIPWRDMPAFMTRLHIAEGTGARAVEFAILTAARSGEVRGATWDEIDLDRALWSIPKERMKGGKGHTVPLSAPTLALLRALPQFANTPLVFPSPRGTLMSDMTMTRVLQRMKVDATVHGMRSAFRDWCSESTSYSRDVAEMALAHAIGNAVEAAYRRGDLMAKRTRLMRDWATYLAAPNSRDNVTPIKHRAK